MQPQVSNDFYKFNSRDCLEVCLILFKSCNLNCSFCFQQSKPSEEISLEKIKEIPDIIRWEFREKEIAKKWKSVVFRIWGGEVFDDRLADNVFDTYRILCDQLNVVCTSFGLTCKISFSSNFVFEKVERVRSLLDDTHSGITTSYDPIYRFKTGLQLQTWKNNVQSFQPECISITLTKQNIQKYIDEPKHFLFLKDYDVYIEYYIFTSQWKFFKPSQDDLYRFYKWYISSQFTNVNEINKIVQSKNNPNGRYCTCNNSCLLIDGKLTFNCLRRSSNLSLSEFFNIVPDEDEYTDVQLKTAITKNKCVCCKHFSYCRNFCLASVLHKDFHLENCALSRIYDEL